MKKTSRVLWIIALLLLAIVAAGGFTVWIKRHDIQRELERATLPEARQYEEIASSLPTPTRQPRTTVAARPTQPASQPTNIPVEVNLAVPFTPQAPHANWDAPYKEFCEEASVLMAMSYIRGETIPSPEVADQKLLAIKAFEDQAFGYYEDTTAEETARIIREFYDYQQVQIISDPTAVDIKRVVASGRLVIVPAAGQQLGNPYFQQPGPLYHMFVVKGYTNDGKFIVNDPGTRRGADFLYEESVIMNAIHDWRADRNIELGRKVILVVG